MHCATVVFTSSALVCVCVHSREERRRPHQPIEQRCQPPAVKGRGSISITKGVVVSTAATAAATARHMYDRRLFLPRLWLCVLPPASVHRVEGNSHTDVAGVGKSKQRLSTHVHQRGSNTHGATSQCRHSTGCAFMCVCALTNQVAVAFRAC